MTGIADPSKYWEACTKKPKEVILKVLIDVVFKDRGSNMTPQGANPLEATHSNDCGCKN